MNISRAILAVLAVLLSAAVIAQTPAPGAPAPRAVGATTVIIIRHAEKQSPKNPKDLDPDLTTEGAQRAARFAEERAALPLDAIYVTQYKRTQQTAAPVAQRKALTPVVVPVEAANVSAWCEDIVKRATQPPPPGDAPPRTILVVTHSDVVAPLLKAFGVGPVEEPKGFGDMWTVTLAPGKQATLAIGRYADPKAPGEDGSP